MCIRFRLSLILVLSFITISSRASILSETQNWIKSGFKDPVIETMLEYELSESIPESSTHQFAYTAVVFRGTGWKSEDVRNRARRVAQIYSQCGVILKSVKIVEVTVPRHWEYSPHYQNDAVALSITSATPEIIKPVIYYVKNVFPDAAAFAVSSRTDSRPTLLDRAWISQVASEKKFFNLEKERGASVDAHELGHILLNEGHAAPGEENLMSSNFHDLNGELTAAQCETIKSNHLVKRIP